MVTPFIYTIRPHTLYGSEEFDVHISRIRRFAGRHLRMTDQLRLDIERGHQDNIVRSIVGHEMSGGELWLMCRWTGFTSELDLPQRAT